VLDSTTSPAAVGIPGQVALATIYMRFLSITVQDLWGDNVGELYQGSDITETDGTTRVAINQTLSMAGTYTDPFGPVRTSVVVAPSDPRVST
jgi:hypothetical protein